MELGKNVFLEVQGDKRRVVIQSYVCLRQGQLEQLLTRKNAKEHEAILAADLDASVIHSALLVCQAKAGHPIRFQPKVEPPTGTVIKITLEYKDKDKVVRIPAQQWIRNIKTKKDLTYDWVFAGSVLIPDPLNPKAARSTAPIPATSSVSPTWTRPCWTCPSTSADDNGRTGPSKPIPSASRPWTRPVLIILEPVLEVKKK